mgnify:CR=1 FL=1
MNQEILEKVAKLIQDAEDGKEINESDITKIIEEQKKMSLEDRIQKYLNEKRAEEITERTIKDIESKLKDFFSWGHIESLEDITKQKYMDYKEYLVKEKPGRKNKDSKGEQIKTINKRITIINGFLKRNNLGGYCLKYMKEQKKSTLENVYTMNDFERLMKFCNSRKEIEKAEQLKKDAKTPEEIKRADAEIRKAEKIQKKKKQVKIILLVFFGLGIRDAELEFVTIESIKRGKVVVTNKGKTREIPVTRDLKKEVISYCEEENITTGCILQSQTKGSKRLSHTQVWRKLQWATGQMRINKNKAHEHSIRHLTGKELAKTSNIKAVADLLGHTSTNTTEIYIQKSFEEQKLRVNEEHKLISDSLYKLAVHFMSLKDDLQKKFNANNK